MTGQAKAAAWAEQFRAKWTKPDDETEMIKLWRAIPPDVHAQLAKMNPTAHGKMEAFIKSIEEKYQWRK